MCKCKHPRWTPLVLAALILWWGPSAPATDGALTPPQPVTDGARKYELARLANGVLDFDSSGTLHVAYWSSAGGLETDPDNAAYVYYRAWTASGGWSAQLVIDESITPDGRIGGRHPNLAVTPDDTVWVVWHDYRHGSVGGNYSDNVEIYGDYQPRGGAFTTGDVRLSTTAGGAADNGYLPRIAVAPNGALSVAWYDFHWSPLDLDLSEICLKTSDAAGAFDLGEAIDAVRMTNFADRGGAVAGTRGYWTPDLAIDATGARHLVWLALGEWSDPAELRYASAAPGANGLTETVLASGVSGYFTPPHIATAPNGDVWIAYSNDFSTGAEKVLLRRRRAGQPTFDPALIAAEDASARLYSADLEIDAAGRVHLVWIQRRANTDRDVFYGIYDPASGALVRREKITRHAARWERPTLTLDAEARPYILLEEASATDRGDIWFVHPAAPIETRATKNWPCYR